MHVRLEPAPARHRVARPGLPVSDGVRGQIAPATDVLQWPVVGRFLRWRHARTTLQLILLAAAAAVVVHGLIGPSFAPNNLATVLTWVHYRGLLVLALLAAGNFFCTGCPLIRVRDWGRRLRMPTRSWPSVLRTKWIGIALFAAVLFTYELSDLWARPAGTAYLVLAYFGSALVVDLVFKGASFCKYVCPIGQFNFVASTLSPLEVQVRDRETCHSCKTFDCIKGRREQPDPMRQAAAAAATVPPPVSSRPLLQRGCELGLFLPAKIGNLDCTFCLDCVQACPHDNVALATRAPGMELLETRRRSSLGRLTRRPDLAALVLLFTFSGLVNAFAMTSPIHAVQDLVTRITGNGSEAMLLAVLFPIALLVVPAVVVGGAATVTRQLMSAGTDRSTDASAAGVWSIATRYAFAFAPLGFGIWLAHYGFHLLTGALTLVPVLQSAAIDLVGFAALGQPVGRWMLTAGMQPGSVYPVQVGFLLLGGLGSLALIHGVSERDTGRRAWAATVPWVVVLVVLVTASLWIMNQPMEMRGMDMQGRPMAGPTVPSSMGGTTGG